MLYSAMGADYEWQEPLEACGLCGKESLPAETFDLYGVRVCVDCRWALSKRRQAAFVVDIVLLSCVASSLGVLERASGLRLPAWVGLPLLALFFFKDGYRGMSPGKWFFGVQVLDEVTLRPAGFWASFKRNLVFLWSWIGVIFVAMDLSRGRRWGDGWARTVVIWRRYADRMPYARPLTLCRRCGYNLTGNVSGICPECSAAIPEHDREYIAAQGLPPAPGQTS